MNNNSLLVEKMISAVAANSLAVAEPQFFGTALSEYFGTAPQTNLPEPTTANAFTVDHRLPKAILARFQELGLVQDAATFFGLPIEDIFNRADSAIWDQILEDVADIKAVYELG